ncbi:MAG: MBL fold metallo-hydrolase [Gammaproteobacteria bacterium]|nr:MBL fold metallo-hydrolase [Gammaproteobacteria bacterium]
MRFASLGSGSGGNATLIEAGETRLLLDCGFPARELTRRLALLDVEPDSLSAILVTHEHQDHIGGVGPMARRYDLPVWMTHGTWRKDRCGRLEHLNLISGHQDAFDIGGISIQPYPVPHDAAEPVQYLFSTHQKCLGVLTDAGSLTFYMLALLKQADALILEFNHDLQMLASGPYPPSLQRRVGGNHGHLNNHQSTALLERLDHTRLQHLFAAHLSEKNNLPEVVRETLLAAIPELESRLTIGEQVSITPWFEIS